MRIAYTCCLMLLALLGISRAEEPVGVPLTDFKTYIMHEIPGMYVSQPIHIGMPHWWDGDMGGLRVKAVYRDRSSPTGLSAYYLNESVATRDLIPYGEGKTIRIVVDDKYGDVYFLHFVYRMKDTFFLNLANQSKDGVTCK